jgi:hypothetical protein
MVQSSFAGNENGLAGVENSLLALKTPCWQCESGNLQGQ